MLRVSMALAASRWLFRFARSYTTPVKVLEGGRRLNIPNHEELGDYHSVWLRHNCQCSVCVTSSNQKTVTGQDLKGELKISNAAIEDGRLLVEWKSVINQSLDHSGSLCLQWLKDNCYTSSALTRKAKEMEPVIGTELPFVEYSSVMDSNEGLWNWLYHLNSIGYCVVTGLPAVGGVVTEVCQRIGNLQKTIYGEIFHVTSEEDPINIAYTTVHLDLHMDLSYYQSPPGLQALHCLKFDECVEGGESVLLDTLPVVQRMREEFPEQFNSLTRIPATFQKIHFNRSDPVKMVYKRPHIVIDRYGKVIKVNWSPAFEGPLAVPEGDIDKYYKAYVLLDDLFLKAQQNAIVHRLKAGEMIIFNNQRILHGRNAFKLNGGVRLLEGCYVNIDEFASKFAVVSQQLNKKNFQIKHVLNESSY